MPTEGIGAQGEGHLGYPAASATGGEDAGWTSSSCGGMEGTCSSLLAASRSHSLQAAPLETQNPRVILRPRWTLEPGYPQLPEQTGSRPPWSLFPAPPETQDILKGTDEGSKETQMYFQAPSRAELINV